MGKVSEGLYDLYYNIRQWSVVRPEPVKAGARARGQNLPITPARKKLTQVVMKQSFTQKP